MGSPVRVVYFGTYERDYPRNRQVVSALRAAGVEVEEVHADIWSGTEHKYAAGPRVALQAARAELSLLFRRLKPFDVLIVGYPGHPDMLVARLRARGRTVVFNPLLSLKDTFVDDRARFRPGSLPARALELLDRIAIKLSDLTVSDTESHAAYMAELGRVPRERVAVCFLGAEEEIFHPPWRPTDEFTCLFVGKFSPLHGIDTIVEAARLAPETRFRIVGSGQLDHVVEAAPPNVQWVRWVDHGGVGDEYRSATVVLGIFGTTGKAARVIPNKVFEALACGAPVVTADTPASRELLRDGHDALLTTPGDAQALVDAVRRLQQDPQLLSMIASNGHETYCRRASETVLGEEWRRLLEAAASRATRLPG